MFCRPLDFRGRRKRLKSLAIGKIQFILCISTAGMQTHLQRAAVVLVCFYPSRSSMRRPSRCTALSIVRSTVLINPNTFLNRGSSHPSVSRRFNNPLLAAAECTRAASGIYRAWSMMEQYPNRAHSRRHQKEKKIQKKKKATLKKEKKGKKNKPKQPALSPQLQC